MAVFCSSGKVPPAELSLLCDASVFRLGEEPQRVFTAFGAYAAGFHAGLFGACKIFRSERLRFRSVLSHLLRQTAAQIPESEQSSADEDKRARFRNGLSYLKNGLPKRCAHRVLDHGDCNRVSAGSKGKQTSAVLGISI